MHYQPYFDITLLHDYYQKQISPDVSIEPSRDCQRILKNHRLALKSRIDGLQVLRAVESDKPTAPLLPLDPSLNFTFLLRLKNSAFTTFTHLESYQAVQNFYFFSNKGTDEPSESLALKGELIQREHLNLPKEKQSLHEAQCSEIEELCTVSSSQIFGMVAIYPNESLTQNGEQRKDFTIKFDAKAQPWTYYLITSNKATDACRFSIVLKDPKDLSCNFTLVEGDDSDRLKTGIQQRFPESRVIRLRSDTPIKCRENGIPGLQLFWKKESTANSDVPKDKPLIANLPNPPNRHGIQVINLLNEV